MTDEFCAGDIVAMSQTAIDAGYFPPADPNGTRHGVVTDTINPADFHEGDIVKLSQKARDCDIFPRADPNGNRQGVVTSGASYHSRAVLVRWHGNTRHHSMHRSYVERVVPEDA